MQDVTMRASGEKLQDEGDKEEEEADEMIDSAAESDDDGQVLASPNSDQCDARRRFRPIRPSLPKYRRKNGWPPPTDLTEPRSDRQPPPMQQTQLEATQEPTPETQLELSKQQTQSGDLIGIRCLVERLEADSEHQQPGGHDRCLVLDTVTPVRGSVPLVDLVEVVLSAHHFDSTDLLGAKGSILPNSKWRAIRLDDVALDPATTVGDIVSGIETSRMILKITLPSFSCEQKLRESLLQFLLSIVSIDLFTKTNCPLDKTMLDQLRVGDKRLNLSSNKLSAFKQWVKEFDGSDQLPNGVHRSKGFTAIPELRAENGSSSRSSPPLTSSPRSSTTTFEPSTELAKLNSWFESNPNPSLTDLLGHVDKLNSRSHRRSDRITLSSVVSWFVEARAKSDLPSLPNKNAVYVVETLLTDSSDSENAIVVQPTDDADLRTERTRLNGVRSSASFEKSDENHNNWSSIPSGADVATDLSLVKRSHFHSRKSWNWKPVALHDTTTVRHSETRSEKDIKREYEVSSGSSSPKVTTDKTLPAASFYPSYPLPTMSGLPIHPHSFHAATMQILQQRALYNFSHPVFVPQSYDIDNMGSPGSGNEENDRRKRSRVFIDPTTEIPRLEQWYLADTHPSAQAIEHYTDELNNAEYRQRFPKLEPKNVQLWFKNHRAKMKRVRLEQDKCESINNGSNGFLGH